ncbi:MAG: hypothetical protein IIC51_07915 [Planctomycetes bacterium]|nr:hypothetical protein [Planctomycetota bacterium]
MNDKESDMLDPVVARTREAREALAKACDYDLDKMVVRPHNEAGCTTDEYLFVHRSGQLTAFSCHVIYTLPLSLAYSHHEQTIKSCFGGHVPVVPMTKIATKPPESKRYSLGCKKFQQIIEKRLRSVGATPIDLCSARVRNELIKLSGGQPTELMTLVREAIIAHGLPIDSKSLQRARREGQREYARQLRSDHWPIIEDVRNDGTYTRTQQSESAFRELLDSRAILQYVNDEEWYGLNPMVAALQPPAASSDLFIASSMRTPGGSSISPTTPSKSTRSIAAWTRGVIVFASSKSRSARSALAARTAKPAGA